MSRVALLILFIPLRAVAVPTELQNCRPCEIGGEETCARAAADRAGITGEDALARLIFAEALSTGYWKNRCNAPGGQAQLLESIAWGVMNRIGRPPATSGRIKDVVFARSQFRASFSGARGNPFSTAFLCPQRAQHYLKDASPGRSRDAGAIFQSAEATTQRVIAEFNRGGIPRDRQNISNFFYPRSEHFGEIRPSWAANTDPAMNRGYSPVLGSVNPCVEFYCLSRPCPAAPPAQPAASAAPESDAGNVRP